MAALVLTGPTASGKSELALMLAERLDGEIISADSAQVYRGMDIGTAKPDAATQARVPHHLIDIRDPADPYSAADFRTDAIDLVRQIQGRSRLPIIAGGTMLYLKALKEGLSPLPEADPQLRADILAEGEAKGWPEMHRKLAEFDPDAAARIKPGDPQRLQRAFEVYRLTGQTLTELHRQESQPCPFPLLEMAIMPPDRAALHQKIADRFERMMAAGLMEEVAALRRDPLCHKGLPAIRAVGYRQIWAHLEGETSRDQMWDAALAATRQLAKRQYTWLRGWQDLHSLASPDIDEALKIVGRSTILG